MGKLSTGKLIFWLTILTSAYRDTFTNASNTDIALSTIAGMAVAIAFEYVWSKS